MPEETRMTGFHEGVSTEVEADTYNPNEEQRAAVKLVESLFTESKRVREKLDDKWSKQYRYFKGDQWDTKRPSYRHSEVLNFLYSHVSTILPLLTDNRPNIETLPQDPSDFLFSEIVNRILRAKWDQRLFMYQVAEAIVDASIYGTAIGCVPWNKELYQGLGDYDFDIVDPFEVFPDPCAQDVNHKTSNYFIRAEAVDLAKLRSEYPDVGKYIQADIGDLSSLGYDREPRDIYRHRSPVDQRTLVYAEDSQYHTRKPQVLKIICYYKDPAYIQEKIKLGDVEKYAIKKKYPQGRMIVTAGQVLLEDGPMPYADGDFPYARLVDGVCPREFWGMGDVELMSSPQVIINKLISYILDYLILMGNPIWIVDGNSNVDTDNLFNIPGGVVKKAAGSEVRRETGVPLPPYIFQTLQYFAETLFGKLSGMSDLSRGTDLSGQLSGLAIENLQEAAQTRLRAKSRNLEMFLTQIGRLQVSRILQYYTAPRVVRITGIGEAAQFFSFHINKRADETGNMVDEAIIQDLTPQPDGSVLAGNPSPMPIKGQLDLRITTGTSLPLAKARKAALAKELYGLQVIDEEELLTQLDYPNKDKILAKLQARREALAQAAAAQGGIPNGIQQASGPSNAGQPAIGAGGGGGPGGF